MASPTRKCCVPPGNVVPLRSAILFSKKKSKEKPYIAYIDTDDIDKIYGQSTTYPVIISTEISTWVTELQNTGSFWGIQACCIQYVGRRRVRTNFANGLYRLIEMDNLELVR
ncbi:hypothetical protein PHYBLDRAFT_172836 [Phycomyces blakesleeanus NRRL 1555(-)]|uniref:Uncharacterized protein n=1 Tax=Phycomyces blakesleeanus (strain ATCC 8743b / DSM 1359 / FGSC 10004 / NBRC 33097 / NRRL 1555) TaxID=763407 RepID=A0A162TJ49_PHYB8|nr:hypothetical protein PHYBLDRAFT_172836 [Phycomyces blakesleeanus NRRL 1555(-)]OAD69002.1 hypothetical protein PHYBLDRAFT_172836 [Phycomyces blakesleeanus NRRL 1555(-)]|eukprot:XP_018287042.1 hypothetical protein PHYBLDRAFT_172836 [Phycomyces blakesleeanus NRRL 1555(-)]